MEEWRDIEGFDGMYEVSNEGRVRSWKNCHKGRLETPKILKHGVDGLGRNGVHLYKGDTAKTTRVHRLVLNAFVGTCPEGMECCHYNGDASDNHLSNLRWDTPKNNQADKLRHGTHNKGSRNGQAKLTEGEVATIKQLLWAKVSQKKIADSFGVSRSAIMMIHNGQNWSHIEGGL